MVKEHFLFYISFNKRGRMKRTLTTRNKTMKKNTEVKSEVTNTKVSALATVQVRTSPDSAEYVQMQSDEGWFQGVGAPRLPELHKDVRLTLSLAVKSGCALFATSGGIRVLTNANGDGGVLFIEKKNMQSGHEFYLLGRDLTKEAIEKAGLVLTKESKGFYISPRTKEGELAFETIAAKFPNNHKPMNFEVHEWPGYKVTKEEKKVAKKKVAKEAAPAPKVEAKVPTGKTLVKKEAAPAPKKTEKHATAA
jgi:hypothetical protein